MLHSESEPRLYRVSRLLCGVCTHLLCAAFTVFVAIIANPGSSEYPCAYTASITRRYCAITRRKVRNVNEGKVTGSSGTSSSK